MEERRKELEAMRPERLREIANRYNPFGRYELHEFRVAHLRKGHITAILKIEGLLPIGGE